jgi:lipoprotein NlpD
MNVMRMKKSSLLLFAVLVAQLVACTTPQNNAPVERRTIAPVEPPKAATPAMQDGVNFHTVKPGETLYRIALESGQSYHDLVAWNNLTNPNDIKVGQVLRVSPLGNAPTPGNAQVGTVTAGAAGLEIKPLPGKTLPGAINATTPRGDKRTYSDQTLAELSKPDAEINPGTPSTSTTPAIAAPATAPAAVAAVAAPAKPDAPATAPANGDDAAVTWIWPTQGKVTGSYDAARKGVDIAGTAGQAIVAAAEGRVMYAGSGIRGYGNLVILKHNNNLLSAYAHSRTILVKEGQTVTRGQKIAEMGNSDSTSVKLHFEIRQQGKPVDPMPYLPPR